MALLADPLASADAIDPNNAANRRLFPQVMRFGLAAAAPIGCPHELPPDPLGKGSHPSPMLDANTPVRVMGLVEEPVPTPLAPDATTMLVFYEFVPVAERPAPAGALVVTFKYWHPGKGAFEAQPFWKAAQQF